jgi:pyridoxamine 5'-phosphate oxidase
MFDIVDPYDTFARWYADAVGAEPDVPNAMSLATVGADGTPSVRTVLMKAMSRADGLQFFTNLGSRKAAQVGGNGHVACLFHWKSLQRQITVEGVASRVSDAIADAYWATRPRGSQLGAWASLQGRPLAARSVLVDRLAEQETRFHGQPVPRPEFWSGFRVEPARFEFWQGRPDRLHDRVEFRAGDAGWVRGALYP